MPKKPTLHRKLEDAHKELKSHVYECSHRYVTGGERMDVKNVNTGTYAILFENEVAYHEKDICYNRVGDCSGYVENGNPPIALLFHVYNLQNLRVMGGRMWQDAKSYNLLRGAYVPWLDYLLNRSPYAQCYMTKSATLALRKYVHVRTDMEVGLMQGGNICLRYGYERPLWIKLWWDLVKRGCSEDLAFVLIHIPQLQYNYSDRFGTYITAQRGDICHVAISPHDEEYVRNFLARKVINSSPVYNEYGRFDNVEARWGNAKDYTWGLNKRFVDSFPTTAKKVGTGWDEYTYHTIDYAKMRDWLIDFGQQFQIAKIEKEVIKRCA